MNLLGVLKLALGSLAMLSATASSSPPVASTADVIKAIESIGLQGNRTITEMVSLVAQKVSNETGAHVSRRLAETKVVGMCGSDLQTSSDISSMPYYSADGCMILCLATIKDCNAVTWTDYNGGTCWFKFVGGIFSWFTTVPKTGAISFMEDAGGLGARTYVNADMSGNDLSSASNKPDSSYCAGRCHFMDDCFASTWTDLNGGTCWYKRKASTLVAKPGAVSSLHYRNAVVGMCNQ